MYKIFDKSLSSSETFDESDLDWVFTEEHLSVILESIETKGIYEDEFLLISRE